MLVFDISKVGQHYLTQQQTAVGGDFCKSFAFWYWIFLLLLLVVLSIVRFPKNMKKHKIEIDSDKFSFGEESINLGNIEYELSFKSNDKIEGKQIWDFTILKPMKKSHTLLLSFDEKEVFENLLKGDN